MCKLFFVFVAIAEYYVHPSRKRLHSEILEDPSNIYACSIPEESASKIASSRPATFDFCSDFSAPHCYQPNARLRLLQAQLEETTDETNMVLHTTEFFLRSVKGIVSWRRPSGGSETKITDYVCQTLVTAISNCVKNGNDKRNLDVRRDVVTSTLCLASASSKPEYTLMYRDSTLLGSEAKGVEASQHMACIQLFQVCGDAALALYRRGLHLNHCVVPGIACADDSIQIFAVYLLEGGFPILTSVSPPLLYCGDFISRLRLAHYISCLASFVIGTMNYIDDENIISRVVNCAALKANSYFYKPVRPMHKDENVTETLASTGRGRLSDILICYAMLLKSVHEAESLFLYPSGVLMLGEEQNWCAPCYTIVKQNTKRVFEKDNLDHTPLLVYPLLRNYRSSKPDVRYRSKYVEKLKNVVHALNTARIAHLDLRPENILWTIDKPAENIHLQVIDFEDVVPFDYLFRIHENMDARYPFLEEQRNRDCRAASVHNNWFLAAVEAWVMDDSDDKFSAFMISGCAALRDKMRSELETCTV